MRAVMLKVAKFRVTENAVVGPDSPTVRRVGASALVMASAGIVILQGAEEHTHHQAAGWLPWSLTILALVALIMRGLMLGRPVTGAHAAVAAATLATGLGAHLLSMNVLGDVLVAGAGAALMWPTTLRPLPNTLPTVWPLVNATHGDPLAPFAMHSRKCQFFSADGTAMLAYRTRLGFAVVSGDPIGDGARFRDLVDDFAQTCRTRGWRLLVLGCSQHWLPLWIDNATTGRTLRAIPFGRDVVIDVAHFDMVGRSYRNLRQAVRRTQNAGVSTEVIAETDLDDATRAELVDVMTSSHTGVWTERGFSMILDRALEGSYPGVLLIIGRDHTGRVQACHRYALAGEGSDVSLDVPWRRPGAPNGIDERLSVDMVAWARGHGADRLSLAFAAFPEIFDDKSRGRLQRLFYLLIHLGDRLIQLESLYKYLRKYHALDERRYVVLSLRNVVPALVALLSLEFMPHRRRPPVRQLGTTPRRAG
jgi:lysylphosphatidylglycerol synthetase-like protein (DUF2156 family)